MYKILAISLLAFFLNACNEKKTESIKEVSCLEPKALA